MSLIFTAFANSETDKLPSLTEEDNAIYKILSKEKIEDGWDIHRDSFTNTDSIADYLLLHQSTVTVFLYSGHAGKDALFLEDEDANAEGIASLLGLCPNLKLVVLNGCSTQGQVADLLDAGIPVVVATSAPVEDAAATKFSIAFFEALVGKNKKVSTAFDEALAVAKVVAKEKIESTRGARVPEELKKKKDSAIWGLFHQPDQDFLLEWQLLADDKAKQIVFTPNELLLAKTWEGIAPYVTTPELAANMRENDKIDKIITELPHPISEFLRKLIAKPSPGDDQEVFYHDFSESRLKFLLYTYITSIELLAFTLLSQLWDEFKFQKKVVFSEDLKTALQEFFSLSMKDRKTYNFIPLIQKMKRSLLDGKEKVVPFIEEYIKISDSFNEGTDFYIACQYMESVKQEILLETVSDKNMIKRYGIELEKQLSVILSQMGFLAKYRMSSMKEISFIKYKHQLIPSFRLNFVDLKYRPSGLDVETELLSDSIDNSSVVIIKEKEDGLEFLNLSPFIIDENSFDDKAKLANLCVFQSFEAAAEAFTFRNIYQPLARPLIVAKSKPYFEILADQFNDFNQLIFDKPLLNSK